MIRFLKAVTRVIRDANLVIDLEQELEAADDVLSDTINELAACERQKVARDVNDDALRNATERIAELKAHGREREAYIAALEGRVPVLDESEQEGP